IRWWWSMFRADALGLFPPRTLVSNIGEDGTATHKPSRLVRLLKPMEAPALMQAVPDFPQTVMVDDAGQQAVRDFLRRSQRPFWKRLLAAGAR
ncbi:MAG TPA: hypothetical protein VFQ69_11035, partial [Rhizomicrobium sp.]|nr:hypothetical protein [Rhizomicrobium sp.]